MSAKKTPRKSHVSPEAAKILEQYRNAGKPAAAPDADENAPASGVDASKSASTPRPTSPPPSSASMRRSGTRGK